MATQRMTTVWIDANGNTTAKLLTTSAGAATVQADIAALSNAAVQLSWEGTLVAPASPTPTAAVYQQVSDQAVLLFQTASGTIVKVVIPAPQSSIFMTDQETVDPAAIATLITDVIANIVDVNGTAVVAYVGGTRQS